MIPNETIDGRLPEGIHPATWAEFAERFGGSDRRHFLLRGLLTALTHFAEAGCMVAYVGGSFVTAKAEPGDVDVCWDVTDVDLDAVHPVFFDLFEGRIATKALFGAEFFPTHLIEGDTGMTMLAFFQQTRNGDAVGVVAIDLDSLEPDP